LVELLEITDSSVEKRQDIGRVEVFENGRNKLASQDC
jgi:hypothetical protein